ncbi:MAG TPA: DUF4129 domain-containing protein [Chloroflexota bacterium]|nr:DUF4129 domain-containing protein [Chloroflexota bacterium]
MKTRGRKVIAPKKMAPRLTVTPDSEEYGYMTNKWSRTAVQPLLIALVTTAFFTALATAMDVVLQTVLFRALTPLFFLISLEGIYTTLWLNHPDRRQLNRLAYRAAEFLVFVLILRFYTWLAADSLPRMSQLTDYLRFPWLMVADGYFVINVILLLLAWVRAISAAEAFNDLAIDEAEVYYFTLPRSEQDANLKPAFSNRMEIVAGLFHQWLWGGVLLALATAVAGVDARTLSISTESLISLQRLPLPPALIWSLFVYFVAGLLLLSQARLGALNARWLHDGASKSPEIERSWHRMTTWLLLVMAVIALFLPLGSTFAIGRVLAFVVSFVAQIFVFLAYLLTILLTMFFAPLTEQSLPEIPSTPSPTPPPATPAPTPIPPVNLPPDETAQMLVSSAFWAVAIVMSFIAISFFLRDRGFRVNTALLARAGGGLLAWLRSLWHDMADYAGDFAQSARNRWQTAVKPDETTPSTPPWRFIRLNSLSPRDQIRYFYLATVRRAAEQGKPRDPDETPLEFAEDLKTGWPDAEAEIEDLTEAFLRARYSRENIEKDDVNPVKQQWRQVKNRLRRSRS